MKILSEKLNNFGTDMLNKLVQVAYKYGGLDNRRSVTSDSFDWSNNETASAIERHLLREVAEFLLAKPDNRKIELVDIANCAFLLAAMIEEGAI